RGTDLYSLFRGPDKPCCNNYFHGQAAVGPIVKREKPRDAQIMFQHCRCQTRINGYAVLVLQGPVRLSSCCEAISQRKLIKSYQTKKAGNRPLPLTNSFRAY